MDFLEQNPAEQYNYLYTYITQLQTYTMSTLPSHLRIMLMLYWLRPEKIYSQTVLHILHSLNKYKMFISWQYIIWSKLGTVSIMW